MKSFLIALLQCSISMSLVTLTYAAILPFLSKRYAAKWRYMVWLVIVAGWLFPFRPRIDLAFLPVRIPNIPITPVQVNFNATPITYTGDIVNASATIPSWWVLTAIWLSGVVSIILYHALRHGRFMKIVRRWSEPVTDLKRLEILDNLKSKLEIKIPVGLSVCQGITSPMLVGFFHPTILLPDIRITDDELPMILKHELIHARRHDLWYKGLILMVTTLHWFNPVVYLMAKATALQCEIACDELVLQDADFEQRKQYGETIISVVRNGVKLQTALSTNFYGGKKGMKNRISSIMDSKQKKAGVAVLCMVLVGIVVTGATFATTTGKGATTAFESNIPLSGEEITKQEYERKEEIEKQYSIYSKYGLIYNQEKDRFFYNGQLVRFFADKIDENDSYNSFSYTDGDIDLRGIRNTKYELIGVEAVGQKEYDKRTAKIQASSQDLSSIQENIETSKSKAETFSVYKQYGLSFNKGTEQLFYNGELVRYFEDYYPIGDNENNAYSGVDYFNENGTIDVHGTRDLSQLTHNSDGSFDPSGKLIGVQPYSQADFNARNIEELKNPPMQETLVYESSKSDTSYTAQELSQESQEGTTQVHESSNMLTPDELAKEYSVYEPFGLTYDKGKDYFYYNGKLVRQFVDVLASNGEGFSSGKFKGAMMQVGSPDGEIEIKAIRDYSKLDANGYGALTGIEVVK